MTFRCQRDDKFVICVRLIIAKIKPMKLLVVEDEIKLAHYLQKGLSEEGFAVDVAHSGVDGLHMALTGFYDVYSAGQNAPWLRWSGTAYSSQEQEIHTCHHADRRGWCGRSSGRSERWRRRLPD